LPLFSRTLCRIVCCTFALATLNALAQTSPQSQPYVAANVQSYADFVTAASDPADSVCYRRSAGAVAGSPSQLVSSGGKLELNFYYKTAVDANGITRYCYVSDAGYEAPTLRVYPGDQLIIHFHNDLPASDAAKASAMPGMVMKPAADAASTACNATTVTSSSTNLHFHGLNVSPACHQDEVIHTIIQPAGEFDYTVQIPANEPSGMYWYHPHPHGFSQNQVLGGATGIIIVEGIQNFNSAVAGLPERILVIRDQPVIAGGSSAPGNDLSLNYVPITYPDYVPATIQTPAATEEFWRVANTAANSMIDLELNYNGVPQNVKVVAVDGVPITDGSGNPVTSSEGSILLPPGARVEFIVTTPAAGVAAQLYSHSWNNGPDGDADPGRPLANIIASASTGDGSLPVTSASPATKIPEVSQSLPALRFKALNTAAATVQRSLYFSVKSDFSQFYITVAGQTPAVFNMDGPPNIVVRSGTVEQWTISNQSLLDHAFHIHQIHFRTLAINGEPVTDYTERDTINVPHWSGSGAYPSVTLLMDFTDPGIVGTFVYHCHILSHEDLGMMGAIQVLPALVDSTTSVTVAPNPAVAGATVTLGATVSAASSSTAAPTGTVTFKTGSTTLGSATLNGSAVATLSTTALPVGSDSVTATYSGDSNFNPSTSAPLTVVVQEPAAAASLTPAALTFPSLTTGSTSTPQTLTLTNTATGALTLGSGAIAITGTAASSFVESTTCAATVAPGASCAIFVSFKPLASGSLAATLSVTDNAPGSPQTVSLAGTATTPVGLQFVPIAPCRLVDTRNPAGPFGGPGLTAGQTREFDPPQGSCGIPSTAAAYSLNVTVLPDGPLSYLTLWPAGQAQPNVSTLNSDGRVKANAAVTPAGTNGGIDIFVSDPSQVVLDIDGYFAPAGTASALAFYPVAPCRIADTRQAAGPFGGPSLAAGGSRDFPVQSSTCAIPSNASAYSLNVTAIPHSTLNYLTAWPAGQAQPYVSTLNSPTGAVVANAAIVPAGSSGNVSIFVSDASDVILDVNGYFATPATGGLSLYTTSPCRAIDTRLSTGAFSGVLAVPIATSACAPPSTAQGYVLNATVVPPGPLDYLTLWPDGVSQPVVSTLNAGDGAITSNMAVVPAPNGTVDAFAADPTNLILDLFGYFAP
jgi:FtsP/CotA-like multicopper oxidase with cupredoxin domain